MNAASDSLLAVATVAGGLAVLAALFVAAVTLFAFFVAPRFGRPLAYGGGVGVLEAVARLVLRTVHRASYIGFDPAALPPGGFIMVANHGSGLDALLLQFAIRRRVRFMMAADQMAAVGAPLWKAIEALPVHYGPQDAGMLRQAARHVKEGGVLGLFPERGIAKAPRTIDPFAEGAGVLAALTRAPVVLCWVRGPRTVGSALLDPFIPRRRAEIELVGVYDFAKEGVRDPREICERLRAELARRSGWAVVPAPAGA